MVLVEVDSTGVELDRVGRHLDRGLAARQVEAVRRQGNGRQSDRERQGLRSRSRDRVGIELKDRVPDQEPDDPVADEFVVFVVVATPVDRVPRLRVSVTRDNRVTRVAADEGNPHRVARQDFESGRSAPSNQTTRHVSQIPFQRQIANRTWIRAVPDDNHSNLCAKKTGVALFLRQLFRCEADGAPRRIRFELGLLGKDQSCRR